MRRKIVWLMLFGAIWLISTQQLTGRIDGLSLIGFFPALGWLAENVLSDFE